MLGEHFGRLFMQQMLSVRRQLTLPVGVNSDCRLNSIKYKGMRFSKGDSNARDLDNNTTGRMI
ncbi:MAG TPA: hypothetical protein VJN02_03520, partial [Gammaproteobacteria bacterium]|nr:hypothetical protein [Gammaproteobacteria bacterium]